MCDPPSTRAGRRAGRDHTTRSTAGKTTNGAAPSSSSSSCSGCTKTISSATSTRRSPGKSCGFRRSPKPMRCTAGGTGSSNPASSSEESANSRSPTVRPATPGPLQHSRWSCGRTARPRPTRLRNPRRTCVLGIFNLADPGRPFCGPARLERSAVFGAATASGNNGDRRGNTAPYLSS